MMFGLMVWNLISFGGFYRGIHQCVARAFCMRRSSRQSIFLVRVRGATFDVRFSKMIVETDSARASEAEAFKIRKWNMQCHQKYVNLQH